MDLLGIQRMEANHCLIAELLECRQDDAENAYESRLRELAMRCDFTD